MMNRSEYHIRIAKGEMPQRVLLPGDPGRAKAIAHTYFDNPSEVARNREYWSFKGEYDGIEVGVCSTGIGCPSAAIAIEELVKVGCKSFIRVGSAGAIDRTLSAGDLVIFSGSVRDDGTSVQYVPIEYPAVADPVMVQSLARAAERRNAPYRIGIGHSKDAFYSEHPDMVSNPTALKQKWKSMERVGVLATEMESAVLFVLGHLRKVRVGTVCVIIGEPIQNKAEITEKPKLEHLVPVALDAITATDIDLT
ncbi:MAG: nucleoside phosphorylase [Candidatus Thorarchaeota archaeon]